MEVTLKQPNLADAQLMAIMHPETFEVPTHEELKAITVGDSVKVCATFNKTRQTTGERFWVDVTSVDGDIITGEVNNDLLFTDVHSLSCGDTIQCHIHHVYSIIQTCQAENNSDSPSV